MGIAETKSWCPVQDKRSSWTLGQYDFGRGRRARYWKDELRQKLGMVCGSKVINKKKFRNRFLKFLAMYQSNDYRTPSFGQPREISIEMILVSVGISARLVASKERIHLTTLNSSIFDCTFSLFIFGPASLIKEVPLHIIILWGILLTVTKFSINNN